MTCHHCEVAGYLNAEANAKAFFSVAEAEDIRELARMWHRRCLGKDCACQHVIGDIYDDTG